jgi:NAD(P)-dependent dehydrogenase (short-subunit alcohol dehydrogenase family)
VVANAGGGPPETSLSLNFFGAVATLEGLRPLLASSPAPRAVAVSSIASLRSTPIEIIEKCLEMDEPGAIAAAWAAVEQSRLCTSGTDGLPASAQTPLVLYGAAKQALECWCRRVAPTEEWAGAGVILNAVALGFYDTPHAISPFWHSTTILRHLNLDKEPTSKSRIAADPPCGRRAMAATALDALQPVANGAAYGRCCPWPQNYWHPIVQLGAQLIGLRGDDGEAADPLGGRRAPVLP